MRTTDTVIQKNQNTAKKKKKNQKSDIKLQNGGKKKKNSISRHKISDQKWENYFPEGIWLIIEDCKYNYTAEIKF